MKTLIIIGCMTMCSAAAHGQYFNYPGVEVSLGLGFGNNQLNYLSQKVPALQLQASCRIPVVFDQLYILPGISAEYTGSNAPLAIETARLEYTQATYLTPGIRAEFQFRGSNSFHHFGAGFGYARRFKMLESNFWNERPNTGFPSMWADQSSLYPAFFRVYAHRKKVALIFESQFIFENRKIRKGMHQLSFNSMQFNVGISYSPARKAKPIDYRPVRRTLMVPEQ